MIETMVETEWRVLELASGEPVAQTAIDEVIAEQVALGNSPPTVRFWKVNSPTISIGKNQDLYADVDAENAVREGITIVRRASGGGSDYISEADLCYSVFIPAHLLGHDRKDVVKNYRFVYQRIERAFKELGINVCFEKPCNIMTRENKKIGNMAQFTQNGAVLIHGKIRCELPLETTLRHLKCVECAEQHSLIVHKEHFAEAMTCALDYGCSPDKLYSALLVSLLEGVNHRFGDLTEQEKKMLREKREKYGSPQWRNGEGMQIERIGFCDEHLNGIPIITIYNGSAQHF